MIIKKYIQTLFPSMLLLLMGISGCIMQESNDSKDNVSTDIIDLSTISLTKQDLPAQYTLLYENHTTEPTIQKNQTGNNITWQIEERYDATYYDINSTDGVMQSILKLDTATNALNLTTLSKDNLLSFDYVQQEIDTIGEESFFIYKNYSEKNVTYTYYTLIFTVDTLFIALAGSTETQSSFVEYAQIIEQRILDAANIE